MIIKELKGFYVVNNECSPTICETYKVIYADGKEGYEFFNGNMWLVQNHNRPVKLWYFEIKNTTTELPK